MIIGISVLLLVPMGFYIFFLMKKWKNEHHQKKLAIERAHALSQWTKKIIIERQNSNPEGPFSAPIVRIEKCKSSHSSGSGSTLGGSRSRMLSPDTMTTITEYELPLDKVWEFPRANLFLDRAIGEGAFGKVSFQIYTFTLFLYLIYSIYHGKYFSYGRTICQLFKTVVPPNSRLIGSS